MLHKRADGMLHRRAGRPLQTAAAKKETVPATAEMARKWNEWETEEFHEQTLISQTAYCSTQVRNNSNEKQSSMNEFESETESQTDSETEGIQRRAKNGKIGKSAE